MRWEVFRQDKKKDYHTYVGTVHAPNAELAKQYAEVQHGRRKPTNSLWIVPKDAVETVYADDPGVEFGGTTQKDYRWATAYSTDETFAEEIEASQREQEEAERDIAEADR